MNLFQAPWFTTGQSVWCHTSFGDLKIADTRSKTLALRNQQLNARLIAMAPEMWDLLEEMYVRAEPEYQVRIEIMQRYILGEG